MAIVAFCAEKGGSCKTTMALHLAWWKAKREKVLLVDLDSQASATRVLLRNQLPESGHIGHALLRMVEPEKVIVAGSGGVDLLPSHPELGGAIQLLGKELGPERRLSLLLGPLAQEYATIVLDCPPGRSLLLLGALLAAQAAVVPVVPDLFGIHGLAGLLELLPQVNRDLGGQCSFKGAIVSRATRTRLSNEAVGQLKRDLGPKLLAIIPDSVKVSEALAASVPAWAHAPGSPVAEALSLACQSIHGNEAGGLSNVA